MSSPRFTPFTLNRLTLPNRWVMPAMQRGMCVGGAASAELAVYYRRRGEGGVPLIGDPDFVRKVEQRDYAAIRTFARADLGQFEWDTSIVEEAHAGPARVA